MTNWLSDIPQEVQELEEIYQQWDRLKDLSIQRVRRDQANGIQLLREASSYGLIEGSLREVWELLCLEQELR